MGARRPEFASVRPNAAGATGNIIIIGIVSPEFP